MRWLLLLLLCWLLFFHHLDQRDLWNSHEARAAQDAQSILDGDAWGMPHLFDGRAELQKPPLYYWLVALVCRVRGTAVDAWSVRLPAALAGCACVLLLFATGAARGRPLAGFLAAIVLALSMHFTWLSRVARVDIPLTLATTTFLLALPVGPTVQGSRIQRAALLIVAYIALAIGLLLKGPIAVVLPTAVAAVSLIVEGRWSLRRPWQNSSSLLREFGVWWGVPLVAALTIPWCWWANCITHGEWFQVFFWHHNLERGLGGADDLRTHPWWFYGPNLLGDFLPWSPVLLLAIWWLWRRAGWRTDAEARLGTIWLAAMLAVLSCMRFKRADYLLPAYPGAALLVGCFLERAYLASRRRARMALGFATLVAACGMIWWVYVDWMLPRHEATRDYRNFAAEIRRMVPWPRTVQFFRTEAHPLVFHVGRPLNVLVEWGKLDAIAALPEPSYVVMPAAVANEWPRYLKGGRLEELLRNTDTAPEHEKPLVLLRTLPLALQPTDPP